MYLELARVPGCSLPRKLAEVLSSLELESIDHTEAVFAGLVEGFFNAYRKEVAFTFRGMVWSAAAVVAKAPTHAEGCLCPPCALRACLGSVIESTTDFQAEEEELKRRWLWRGTNDRTPIPDPIVARRALSAEFIPKEIKRLAAEFDAEVEKGGAGL